MLGVNWGAIKRTTDALVLARIGEEPEPTPETGDGINELAFHHPAVVRDARMVARYYRTHNAALCPLN